MDYESAETPPNSPTHELFRDGDIIDLKELSRRLVTPERVLADGARAGRIPRLKISGMTTRFSWKAVLEEIDTHARERVAGDSCLELGCGTAGFLAAVEPRFRQVLGIDIALRWLIIGKKRLEATGSAAQLVCCNAEHLPFRDEVFGCVVGIHMLEHTQDRHRVVTEAGRVLRNGGIYFFSTPNRFSLTPEPCVRVWGVGFLPRPLAGAYVRLVKGIPYRHIRLMSAFELKRLFAESIFHHSTISLSRISPGQQRALSPGIRILVSVYHAFLHVPVLSSLMRLCAPLLKISGRKRRGPVHRPQGKA